MNEKEQDGRTPPRFGDAEAVLRISVIGRDGETDRLDDWLRSDPDLRGQVRRTAAPTAPGTMGAGTELTVALVSSGSLAVLGRCIGTWLVQRRTDVTVRITDPSGRRIMIDVRRAPKAEKILNRFCDAFPDSPGTGDGE